MSDSFPNQSAHPYGSLYAICRPLECPSAPPVMVTHGCEEGYCPDGESIITNSNTIDKSTTRATSATTMSSLSPAEEESPGTHADDSTGTSVDSDDILTLLTNPGFDMDAFLGESDSNESKEHEPSPEEDIILKTRRRLKYNGDARDCMNAITEEEDGDEEDSKKPRTVKYNGDVLDCIDVITEEEEDGGGNIDMELKSACSARTISSRRRRKKLTVETQMSHYFPRPATKKRPRTTTIRHTPHDNRPPSSCSMRVPLKKRKIVKKVPLVSKRVPGQWFRIYERLVEYKKRHDGSIVVTPNEDDKELLELLEWASDQRYKLSRNQLTQQQVALLDGIGFMDGASEEDRKQWYFMYRRLLDYKKAHGDRWRWAKLNRHCDVDPELGLWAEYQASLKDNNGLLLERRQLLDKIGFRWNLKAGFDTWMKMYDQLVAYQQMYGTTVVGKHGPDVAPLRLWINKQRFISRRGGLTDIRAKLLNDIGFVWDYSNCYAEAIAAAAASNNNSQATTMVPETGGR